NCLAHSQCRKEEQNQAEPAPHFSLMEIRLDCTWLLSGLGGGLTSIVPSSSGKSTRKWHFQFFCALDRPKEIFFVEERNFSTPPVFHRPEDSARRLGAHWPAGRPTGAGFQLRGRSRAQLLSFRCPDSTHFFSGGAQHFRLGV